VFPHVTGSAALDAPAVAPLAAPGAAGPRRRPSAVVRAALLVGLAVAAWAMIALPARATFATRTTADEPQYLLSALSLWEDHDLAIGDELAARRYRPFHEATLPTQTQVLPDGREVSPHDPLLPALLAVPMGLGGWVAAKATLAALAGLLAAVLVWTAHRRFAVPLAVAAGTVLAFGVTAPLTAYATQVYPELPAGLAVAVAIAALTGSRRPRALVGFGVAVVALPWLGVKYVPVAVALTVVALVLLLSAGRRRAALGLLAGLGVAGLAYVVAHRVLYGGWTVYAAGDHFTGGELTVMGDKPDRIGRSRRLAGLLLDHGFGLAAWMPGYLLAVPGLAIFLRRRPPGWAAVVAPLAAGWATATWVALTMHGWWWPGRQVVVVAPCLVLVVAWWAGRVRAVRWLVAGAAAWGAVMWTWLVAEVLAGRHTLIVDFERTGDPLYRAWRAVLPDYRNPGLDDWLRQAVWFALLAGALAWAWRADSRAGAVAGSGAGAVSPSPPRLPARR
jgi:hypothetical protein